MNDESIHPLALPIAIFAGGALIAAAIFFSDGSTTKPADTEDDKTRPSTSEITLPDPSPEDYIKGNLDAEIVIVEYSDTECPFCKRFHETMNRIVDEYEPDEVAWIYRHFPIESLHSKAPTEAHALECAGELGGNDTFWAYTDRLFEITPSNDGLSLSELPNIAEAVGLSREEFQACMDSDRHAEKIQSQYNDALTAAQSAGDNPGTPYSIAIITKTGDKFTIRGAQEFSKIKSQIDAILGK